LLAGDGAPLDPPLVLTEPGARNRRPVVATDGMTVWLAWERYVGKSGGAGGDYTGHVATGGADVVVLAGTCR
jgi:hypothetical protein